MPGNGQTVRWIDDLPDSFADDYRERFSPAKALNEPTAAALIYAATRGATIVGAVPSFDTERLSQLLRRNGIEPPWHYHLMDVENLVLGICMVLQPARSTKPGCVETNRTQH